ncbi:MAG: diaminopimelate epimerase [Nitrospinae bacterium]|nr:diaminopimelate epimerase [Nitrospinota bacterium]
MAFTKMHGNGNDFVVIDNRKQLPVDWDKHAEFICDRRFGIGCDQLLLIENSTSNNTKMRIYNADGSEVEMCGNGIRCFAKYVYERGIISSRTMKVETLAGTIIPEVMDDGTIKVDMGKAILNGLNIPTTINKEKVIQEPIAIDGQQLSFTAVSMGNPHAVFFVDDVKNVPLTIWGPEVENHKFFPKRINVEFIEVISRNEVNMRVWERGASETLACGTGACASVVASFLNDKTDRNVLVHLKGGDLEISYLEDGTVFMTGGATEVFDGEIEL